MKVQVLLRTEGELAVVVGEAEGETWPEMQTVLPALLRGVADRVEAHGEVPDAAP
ncbi:hypothetical protein ACFV3N_16790 [Streptomyces bauhiniae]|uniref:hypothetical protein n=1 Tax=Streptomyces bauhiniae TaxID=2340725 RepID=UPI00364B3717